MHSIMVVVFKENGKIHKIKRKDDILAKSLFNQAELVGFQILAEAKSKDSDY